MFSEEELLPISALQHFIFCERRAALIHLEAVWEENQATSEGLVFHGRSHEPGVESRGPIRIARGLMIRSLRLGLSGKTDVVEFHLLAEGESGGVQLDDARGLWRPYPIEYKRGRLRHERSFEVQLCAQAFCLEEMLETTIPSGAIFYGKTVRRQEVIFNEDLRRETELAAIRLHELIGRGETPAADYIKNKCEECSLFDLCLPYVTRSRESASRYLTKMLKEIQ
jgi:CRISPR-associated exonuclease Cas4